MARCPLLVENNGVLERVRVGLSNRSDKAIQFVDAVGVFLDTPELNGIFPVARDHSQGGVGGRKRGGGHGHPCQLLARNITPLESSDDFCEGWSVEFVHGQCFDFCHGESTPKVGVAVALMCRVFA